VTNGCGVSGFTQQASVTPLRLSPDVNKSCEVVSAVSPLNYSGEHLSEFVADCEHIFDAPGRTKSTSIHMVYCRFSSLYVQRSGINIITVVKKRR
jgi:hypothetical protein